MRPTRPCSPTRPLLPALLLLPLALTGCMEREETLDVLRDGGVLVTHVLRGDVPDFEADHGDALPAGAPWTLTQSDRTHPDGRVERTLEARAKFAAVEALPTSFGGADDPAPLRWATTLAVEALPDGRRRWTLERRYAPRIWAWRALVERRAFPDDLRQALARKPEDGPLPEALVARALGALLAVERAEVLEHLEAALTAAAGRAALGPAARLEARTALAAWFDATWTVEAVSPALAAGPEALRALDARFRAETAARAATAAGDALARAGMAPAADPRAAFEAARRTLDATEDLRDEALVLRVRMPAPVVAHDADALEDDGRTVVLRFRGEDLCDREQVLRVVAEAPPAR